MWNFFSNIKKNVDLRDNLKRICKSINFVNRFDYMPTLEFKYTLKDGFLKIEGPFQSFANIDPYELTYLANTGFITFNGQVMDSHSFGHLHKTMQEVYSKLIARENFIKGIDRSHRKLVDHARSMSSGSSSDDSYRSNKSDSYQHRSGYVNTDIIYGSDDCGSSSSSDSRSCRDDD